MRAHLSLNVKDVSRSITFYSQVFGQEPQKKTGTYAKFDIQNPALNFSLLEAGEKRQLSRVNHLGIEVESAGEVKAWADRLAGLGLETLKEEGTDCCYALQDKVWFRDPDGNAWEVFFVHSQLPTEAAEPPKQKVACGPGSGCC